MQHFLGSGKSWGPCLFFQYCGCELTLFDSSTNQKKKVQYCMQIVSLQSATLFASPFHQFIDPAVTLHKFLLYFYATHWDFACYYNNRVAERT